MADQKLQRTLTIWDGVALAVGSIAGAGILHLPSLTYVIARHDVLVVWLAGTLICLPLLFMFADMVRLIDDGSGIEGCIARGLGSHVASTVPMLFLSVVVLGIPAGALVAGSYLSSAIGGGRPVQLVGELLVLAVAIVTNLFGAAIGARVQRSVTWGLLIVVAFWAYAGFENLTFIARGARRASHLRKESSCQENEDAPGTAET